ncbi:MAG TPA: hypothetical protein VMV71_02330 [Candidatus Paceibacterota bacterium]|nr:hypothetical protein [Candidatus Paceibacterota bacterium]
MVLFQYITFVHMKAGLKEKAISLRQGGFSYSEILKEIPIAKSTLSLWLRSVDLSKRQKQRITEKRLAAALRGGEIRKNNRILTIQKIHEKAARDIHKISKRELWLMGVMLYWAEGTKEKDNHPGCGVQFTNSDPDMIKLFLRWLFEICAVKREEVYFDIFIHENHRSNIGRAINYWSGITGYPSNYFPHIYFKKNIIKTKRKNVGDSYFGLIKIRVKASSNLSRKIAGWTRGVIEYFR